MTEEVLKSEQLDFLIKKLAESPGCQNIDFTLFTLRRHFTQSLMRAKSRKEAAEIVAKYDMSRAKAILQILKSLPKKEVALIELAFNEANDLNHEPDLAS